MNAVCAAAVIIGAAFLAAMGVLAIAAPTVKAEELMTAVEFAVELNSGGQVAAIDQAAAEQAAVDQAAIDQAVAEQAAIDQAASDQAASDQAITDQAASDQATSDQAVSDQVPDTASLEGVVEPSISSGLTIGAYTNNRDNMMYLSVRDLAEILNGTRAQFQFALDQESWEYVITKGIPYTAPEIEPEPKPDMQEGFHEDEEGNILNEDDEIVWKAKPDLPERPEYEYLDMYINPLRVDGNEVKYYSYQLSLTQDLYMNPTDIQMMLGVTLTKEPGGVIRIETDRGFDVDITAYEQDGYFDFFNGVVVGDATTGEILYGYKADNVDAIASTSKLMTYLIAARYLENGRIHMDDKVVLSENVGALIDFGYGILPVYVGDEVMFKDLMAAMMLSSSNEAALAIAEHVAGSETEFVRLMNEMAELLGLETARFCNSNGLPEFSDSLIASVQENQMSAADLFRLSAAVLQKYPGITEFSAQKKMYCPSLDLELENTNHLLYNMTNCIGLKTGTTDEAGCCLVAATKVTKDDGVHDIIAIVLGANNNIDRYQVPQLLLTWAEKQ